MQRKIFFVSFLQVLLILSIGCKTQYKPVQSRFTNLKVGAGTDSSRTPLITERFLKPYRKGIQDSFSKVLTTTPIAMVKKRPGGSLGNLVTSAMLGYYYQYMDTHKKKDGELPPCFVLMNYGGIRLKEIPKGPITVGKIFELLPFENTIVQIEISGSTLANLLRTINKTGGWPSLDVNFPYESENEQENKSTASLEEIAAEPSVLLITNNYIAQGGDNCSVLKTLPQQDSQILLRNAVINYLKDKKTYWPDNQDYIIK